MPIIIVLHKPNLFLLQVAFVGGSKTFLDTFFCATHCFDASSSILCSSNALNYSGGFTVSRLLINHFDSLFSQLPNSIALVLFFSWIPWFRKNVHVTNLLFRVLKHSMQQMNLQVQSSLKPYMYLFLSIRLFTQDFCVWLDLKFSLVKLLTK